MSNIILDAASAESTRRPVTLNPQAGLEDTVHDHEETLLLNQLHVENEDIDSLFDIAAGLEAIHQNASTGADVDMLKAAIKTQYVRIGLENLADSIYDYDVGMENITQTVKKIWAAIKDAMRRAMATVKKWWRKLTDRTESTAKRAKELTALHAKLKGNAKEENVSLPLGAGGRLQIKGKVDAGEAMSAIRGVTGILSSKTAEALRDAVQAVTDQAKGGPVKLTEQNTYERSKNTFLLDTVFTSVNDIMEVLESQVTLKRSKINKISKEIIAMFYTRMSIVAKYEIKLTTDDIADVYITDPLPGNKVLGMLGSKKAAKTIREAELVGKIIAGARLMPTALIDGEFVWKTEKVTTLNLNEIGEVGKFVSEIVDLVVDYNKIFNNTALNSINKMMKAIDDFTADITPKTIEELAEKTDTSHNNAQKNMQSMHRSLVQQSQSLRRMSEQPALSLISYLMSTSNALLAYGEKSAAQYEGA